jgi:hypothetical protein
MPLLEAASKKYSGSGFSVVGVAVDDPDAVATMLKSRPVDYPILLGNDDTLDSVGDNRGVLPYSLLVGPDGKMIALRAGSFPSADNLERWIKPHLGNSG